MKFPIANLEVYGLERSIKVSKYPMSVNPHDLTKEITPTVLTLGQAERGSGHDQFLTGIIAQFDLTFTVKAWTEEERYHFIDFVSSQSTMHRITKFNLDNAYCEYVDPRVIEIMKELVANYNNSPTSANYLKILYTNPTGFYLTAGMTTNYRQLKTMFLQRWNHRLPEWRMFCFQLIMELPQFRTLCLGPKHEDKVNTLLIDIGTLVSDY